ncbi:anthranilate synthase component II [Fulvivirga lutea]|uniref:Aminodeoxychorismate/anthranilate synthase component II n=1 Tax=Fulvivirga lutea TaxID=2810512 RepID=A0A974WHE0_9BACT|nr:aminodeoxychorismate/anthranilate synthase component II [Fulvivirga lutea]QSE98579.1 aminodeoxychorismate/anthranilate synthase component II [Fulvivirga lutea]
MVLLLDNFDSFTFNLVDYFAQLGINCHVLRNDTPIGEISTLEIEAIILSPGPEIPTKAGVLLEVIDHYYNKVPILGICLGHQALGQFFGMNLIKAPKPRHGKITAIQLNKSSIFRGLPQAIKVVQYNSLILESGHSSDIDVIAISEYGHIMAIAHKSLPIWGLQFHPEAALTEYGIDILKNWVETVQLKR